MNPDMRVYHGYAVNIHQQGLIYGAEVLRNGKRVWLHVGYATHAAALIDAKAIVDQDREKRGEA